MRVVVSADIHGVSEELRGLLSALGDHTLLSPWSGHGHPYASEQEAVSAFHERDGLSTYARQIADAVNGRPAFLIGFSVGATSVWRYIASTRCSKDSHAVMYYGSRIRESLELVPRCSASVVLAEHEQSFEPRTIAAAISKSGADCTIIPGTHHGFMNPISPWFRADVAHEQIALLAQAIAQGTPWAKLAGS